MKNEEVEIPKQSKNNVQKNKYSVTGIVLLK